LIAKTSAIVLKVINFSESSLIVTMMTREHGKIAVIAKGARKPKNKLSGLLSPGEILEVVYYYKNTRNVQTLTEAAYLHKLFKLRTDVFKMSLALSVLELVNQLTHENEINIPVFNFLIRFLPWLNDYSKPSKLILPYVQIQLADLSGIGLQLNETDRSNVYLNISNGEITGSPKGNSTIKLTYDQYTFIKMAVDVKKNSIFDINMSKNELKDLIHHLDMYFRYHIEGIKERKSDHIFDQLFDY